MKFPSNDNVAFIPEGMQPVYDANNPLMRMVQETQKLQLASERECYYVDSLQYLFPYRSLTLYGPGQGDRQAGAPAQQNIKTDFQKQNISDFTLGDFFLVRGYVAAGDWAGVFVKVCYRGTPGTELGKLTQGSPGEFLQASVKVGDNTPPQMLKLPLNPITGHYEVELWSFDGANLRSRLDVRGQAAFDLGLIVPRPDMVKGSLADFEGPGVDQLRDGLNRQRQSWELLNHAPLNSMHPIRPLRVEVAFANETATVWDSRQGANYTVVFDMALRGWRSFLGSGISANPHGGVGFLEFRNLFSNYFHESKRQQVFGPDVLPELGRDLIPGNYDAYTYGTDGSKPVSAGQPVTAEKRECFMAVDYMDLHILLPECAIGIHRHRDNQEVFMMLEGHGLMLVGDWCEFPGRERCFELRTLLPGDLALCKTGQLHALYNVKDEPCRLFMFGGYD